MATITVVNEPQTSSSNVDGIPPSSEHSSSRLSTASPKLQSRSSISNNPTAVHTGSPMFHGVQPSQEHHQQQPSSSSVVYHSSNQQQMHHQPTVAARSISSSLYNNNINATGYNPTGSIQQRSQFQQQQQPRQNNVMSSPVQQTSSYYNYESGRPVINTVASTSSVYGGGSQYLQGTSNGMQYRQSSTSGQPQYLHSPVVQYQQQYSSSRGGVSMMKESSGEPRVISERYVEHEVRVPKKVVREEIVEKVIVVPERVYHEEVIEEMTVVRQKIIEVAKPIIQERIIEVPEIEYIERIVEVPQVIIQEKIREVPKFEIQERIVEIPKIIMQEKIVEIPEVEYIEVLYEKFVEVPEIVEHVIIKKVPVPQYRDKPIPEYVDVEVEQYVDRHIPVPVELITTVELQLPQLRPRYTKIDIPLYVPRFVEVALPAELLDSATIAQAESYAAQVSRVASQAAASLCEVERLGGELKALDGHYQSIMAHGAADSERFISEAWQDQMYQIAGDVRNIPLKEKHSVMHHRTAAVMESNEPQHRDRSTNSSRATGDATTEQVRAVSTSSIKKGLAGKMVAGDDVSEESVAVCTEVTLVTKTVIETPMDVVAPGVEMHSSGAMDSDEPEGFPLTSSRDDNCEDYDGESDKDVAEVVVISDDEALSQDDG